MDNRVDPAERAVSAFEYSGETFAEFTAALERDLFPRLGRPRQETLRRRINAVEAARDMVGRGVEARRERAAAGQAAGYEDLQRPVRQLHTALAELFRAVAQADGRVELKRRAQWFRDQRARFVRLYLLALEETDRREAAGRA